MDAKEIAARIEAGRMFTYTIAGVTFSLRRPDPSDIRQAFADADGDERIAARKVLDRSLMGWDRMPASLLMPGGGDDAVPFDDLARKLFLDQHTGGYADELYVEIGRRVVERRRELEGTAGN